MNGSTFKASVALALALGLSQSGYCNDEDALSMVTDATPAAAPASPLRLALELAAGRIDRRYGLPGQQVRRAAIDLRYSVALSEAWRFSLSDRFDYLEPVPDGERFGQNSVREAFFSWQPAAGNDAVEIGRQNVRHGPASGFNPTDYFRAGATQTITTADPVALRENRLGTWMLRGSRLGNGSGVSLAFAPRLVASGGFGITDPNTNATNKRDRLFGTVSRQISEQANVQVLVLAQRGLGSNVGANFSTLATEQAVIYGEWSYGPSDNRPDRLLPPAQRASLSFHQAALGATYTLSSATAVTAEVEYNQAGLRRAHSAQATLINPLAVQSWALYLQASQELLARSAVLVYVTHKGLLHRQLDLSGYVRKNIDDRSTVAWVELRYHWHSVDAVLQWQSTAGNFDSQNGSNPYRKFVQAVTTWYF